MTLTDTSKDAEKVQIEVLRRMGPEGRLQAGIELTRMSRLLLAEGIRRRHPDYDDDQIRLATIRLTLPADLFHAAYPEAGSLLILEQLFGEISRLIRSDPGAA